MVVAISIGYIVLMCSKNVALSPLKLMGLPSWSVTRMLIRESASVLPIQLYIKLFSLMERRDPGGLSGEKL